MIQDFGKIIITFGVILIVIGTILWFFGHRPIGPLGPEGKLPLVGKLPGDILVKRENFTFYAPIATVIVISIILSIIFTIISNLKR